MKQKHRSYKLKKDLTLLNVVLLGIGIILGAGVYALIGVGAGLAGNMLWAAFAISALIAIFSGLSYAELSSVFSSDAAEYNYTKKAFKREWLSFSVSWIVIVAGIISAATVAIGFGGYFSHILGGDINVIASILIILLSALSYFGIKDSARFNNIASVIEISGLILIIAVGVVFFGKNNVNYFELPATGFSGLLSAVAIVFFAYIGFEGMVNLSEEVKDSKKILPKALIISILISTALYILVSASAINILGAEGLAKSNAPLTETISKVLPNGSFIMSIIALFATGNTVLIILIVISRIIYGMSKENTFPKIFSSVGKRRTPYISIAMVGAIGAILAFIGNLKFIASMTDLGVFIVYTFVNISLIKIRYSSGYKAGFKSPSIGRFPVLAFLGMLSTIFMFFYFEWTVWALEAAVIILGLLIFGALKRRH